MSAAAERRQAIVALEAERTRLLSTVAAIPSAHAAKEDRLEELEHELERLRRLERWQRVEGKR